MSFVSVTRLGRLWCAHFFNFFPLFYPHFVPQALKTRELEAALASKTAELDLKTSEHKALSEKLAKKTEEIESVYEFASTRFEAERKTVAALKAEISALKEEMKGKDESFERQNVETLKRQIEQLKRARVREMAENEKLKSQVEKMKEEDRDFLSEKMRLGAMHQEAVMALRKRISALEAVKSQDKAAMMQEAAIRHYETLKRRVEELESLRTSPSIFNALAGVASVMSRANRRCTAKEADELREKTCELVRLAVAGDGLTAGELKQRQDTISSGFFTLFSHVVMRLEDERVEELKRCRRV